MKNFLLIIAGLLIGVGFGCSKKPEPLKAESFFVDWLTSHGETEVLVDSAGVGVAGNTTRLKASLYGFDQHEDEYSLEIEFRIYLPSNDEIIEFLSGSGKTKEEAEKDIYLNFAITTFHVIYKGFINPSDPHQSVTSIENNGRTREIIMGNTYIRGTQEDPNLLMEIQPLESQIKDVITSLPLSKKAHWLKIIYSQIDYKPLIVEVTMDNQGHEGLTEAIKKLNWPKHKYLYFAKQFIFVKALNEDQALPIERKDED